MATFASAGTGNWNTGGTWVGGVVPALGDKITIAAGHTVTVDTTSAVCGDDTLTALTINGTLKASRSVNSTLRLRGGVVFNASGSAGTWDWGTSGDPIPSGVKAIVYLNDSATLSIAEFGIVASGTTNPARFYSFGDTRTRFTTSTADCASGQANITVSSVSGWEVGDIITVGSSNTYTQAENKIIQSIAGNVVTCTTNFTYSHTSGVDVVYSGGNVQYRPYNSAYPSHIYLRTGTSSDGFIEIQNSYFYNINGTNPAASTYGLSIYQTNTTAGVLSCTAISNNSFYCDQQPSGNTMLDVYQLYYNVPISGNSFASNVNTNGTAIYGRNSTLLDIDNCCFVKCYTPITSTWNAGVGTATLDNCKFNACYRPFSVTVGFNFTVSNCDFNANYINFNYVNCGKFKYSNCNFNKGPGTPSSTFFVYLNTLNSSADITLDNCNIEIGGGTSITSYLSGLQTYGDPVAILRNLNQEGSPLNQEYYYQNAYIFRDNSTYSRGTSSIRMENKLSGWASLGGKILTQNGVPAKIIGRMRYNSDYATTNKPKVTISGLGITPVSYQMTDSYDTWETYELNVTQNSGADGELDITFEGNSANLTTGYCWFDGVPIAPFITSVRHYGYIFNPTSATRIADPITVKTESAANAVTGVTIDDVNEKVTFSATVSVRDAYDYIKANRCQTSNLSQPNFFTSTDGINFTCEYDAEFTSTGILTGTGTLNLGTKTATIASGGGSELIITDVSGTYVSISIAGMTAGSRVYIYDLDNTTELYNDVVAGTSLTLPFTYTTDTNLNVRIMYVDGTEADIFYDQNWTVTSSGLSITITPQTDTVYETNAVDGSTITGITITDSSLRLEIDSGTVVDYSGTDVVEVLWENLYAYETYWLGTEEGIRDESRFILATDTANYSFYDFKIRNDTAYPVVIIGGWGRDSVTGKSATLVDYTGGAIHFAPDHVVAFETTGGGSGATAAEVWSYATRRLSTTGITDITTGLATEANATTNKNAIIAETDAIKSKTNIIPALL